MRTSGTDRLADRSRDPVRVLHVDDETDLAELAADYLEREDERLSVETATSASEGIEALAEQRFDCVVSDHDMPGTNGIEFLTAVRDEYPNLPFILYTGKGSEEVASDAISAGVTDYLQKETGTDQYALLANRIVNAVERARAERARDRHLQAIETAQEGISILDEDEEFLYVNEAYADIFGYDPAELVGQSWELLYRADDMAAMREAVFPLLETTGYWQGESVGRRADGSTVTLDHSLTTTDDGAIICTVQDASRRKEHERDLEDVHKTARSFMRATTATEVADIIVDAVDDVLGLPANSVHFYDEDERVLRPVAWTDRVEDVIGEVPPIGPGEGLAWEAFETGEPGIYGAISSVPGRLNPDTAVESEIILPLDDHGVALVGSREPGAFDESDVSLARTLVAHATTALDRLERADELREEREFVDQALDSLTDIFYVVGTDGTLLRWNDRFGDVTGYTDEEIAGLDVTEFIPRDERAVIDAAIERTFRSDRVTVESEVLTADGERIPYEFTGGRLTDADGELIGLVGVGRDLTDRKQREARIEDLQQRTRALMHTSTREETARTAIDTAHDVVDAQLSGFHLVSDDGDRLEPVAYVDTVGDVFDAPPVYDRTAASDPAAALVWEVFESGKSRRLDDVSDHERLAAATPARSVIVHPLGEYGVFIVSATEPHAFDDTDEALVEIIATSLTTALDRVEQERNLRERDRQLTTERQRFNALFQMIPEPVTHTRFEAGEPVVVEANPAFEETFDYDDATATDQRLNDIVVPSGREAEAERLDEQVRAGQTVKREVRRDATDGLGDFLFRSVPVGESDGTDEYIAIYVDVSDQKSYERQLERQNERLDEFASIVSHDLRNPLTVAQGRLEIVREECSSGHLDAIDRAHDRMAELIEDVLLLSQAGETVQETEPVPLAATVEQCWRTVDTAGATLVTDVDREIVADRSQLRRLLANLVRNAVEHGGADVTVTVADLPDGFSISDDGAGIPVEDRSSVFEAGFSSSETGTGLGLNIVEQIAEAHGWDIDVTESEAGGAAFEITGVESRP